MQNSKIYGKLRKALIFVPLLLLTVLPGLTSAESVNDKELAKQSVTNYIEAIKAGNIDEAVKWVIDTRFNSSEEQLSQYKDSLITNPFANVEIESILPNSDKEFTVVLDLTRKEDGEINKVSLPIIQNDGNWKLLLDGQETQSKAVEKILTENKLILPFAAASTLLGSYGDTTISPGGTNHIYSSQFNMTDISIGITGWQQHPGSISDVTVRYNVVYKGLFSDDSIGELFHTGFNTWSGSAFYETIRVGATSAPQGVYLKITNPSVGSSVQVKGHIYGN